MSAQETAQLLRLAAARAALADGYEAEAVALAERGDRESLAQAADLFTVAAGLRGRARFR
ncbi:hypothetical protein GGQ80_002066 [Sphingomonas jinjuensis]|uniref:Uncharacterized protein n=1 Tax=Sphingomonas jinjuensis TaxID=535907 RepID=A0A840FD31_9SPHN|nr:hypothetical protein [Sphingomonas jinjuensis]MBB4154156.1 hypothetical protein [Sphingomonas jinjuensis]